MVVDMQKKTEYAGIYKTFSQGVLVVKDFFARSNKKVTTSAMDFFHDHVYLLGTATLLLAVVVALYCANIHKDDKNDKPKKTSKDGDPNEDNDTVYIDNGIVGKIKTARWKSFEAQLTDEQLEEERKVEREQLAAIFELLKKQESQLNVKEIDETELNAQLNLYR